MTPTIAFIKIIHCHLLFVAGKFITIFSSRFLTIWTNWSI